VGEKLRETFVAALKANWVAFFICGLWAAAAMVLANEYGRWIPALLAALPLLAYFLSWKLRRVALQKKIFSRFSVGAALLAAVVVIFPAAFGIEHAILKHRYKAFGARAVVSLLLPPRVDGAATAQRPDPTDVDAFFSVLHLALRVPLERPPYSSYLFVGPEDAKNDRFLALCEALKNLSLVGSQPAKYLLAYSDESGTPIEIVFASQIQPLESGDQLHVSARLLDRANVRLNSQNDIDVFVSGDILESDDERHRVSLIVAYRLVQFLERTFDRLSSEKIDFGPMWQGIGSQIVDFANYYASNNARSPNSQRAMVSAGIAEFMAQHPSCLDSDCIETLVGTLDAVKLTAVGEPEHEVARATVAVRYATPEQPR
jgi:hypothetical protein